MKTKSHLFLAGLVLGLIHGAWAQPVITNQPQNQTNIAGTTATFTVGAIGAEPLSYQWRSHANATSFTNIPFGTEATLVLTNVQPTSRRFGVVVTDAGGLSATSSPLVTLTVLLPPSITNQPTDQIADVGATATFTVTATGTAPFAYQWRFNDVNLSGKTSASLVLANVRLTNAGHYSVVVTNAVGSVTSRVAVLTFTTVHRFEGIAAKPDHTISLSLAGIVPSLFAPYYDIYPLEASTNLMNWSPLAMLQRTNNSSDALSYLDSNATNFDKRLYRTPTNFLITPFPKPSGPYPVGTVSRLMTDPSRTNRYNIPTNSSFMVTYWYPAEARAGVLPEAYVENNTDLLDYLNERSPNMLLKFVSHAFPGLPLATNQASYPVLIYSHSGATRRQNTDKALELASHGYVVAAMDYPYASAVFPDGQLVYGVSPSCNATVACYQPTLDNAILDIRFVLDDLTRLNTSGALFAGRLDLKRLGIFALSVGNVYAAEFCRIDARCKAMVLLDAASTLDLSANLTQLGLAKPFLSMNCESSAGPWPPPILGRSQIVPGSVEWLASTLAFFAKATHDAFWFQIQDSGHASFGDRGSLVSDPSLTVDPTPASRGMSQTIRACTLSFFDKYLKNQDDHLLDNPAAVYPNIINFRSK
jgi:predicted dienelactone hydrolase